MAKINTSDFQKGIFIEFKSEPHQIVDMQFVNPGKGSAFVRTKLKNIKTGKSRGVRRHLISLSEIIILASQAQKPKLTKKNSKYCLLNSKTSKENGSQNKGSKKTNR